MKWFLIFLLVLVPGAVMAEFTTPLKELDEGSYSEIVLRANPHKFAITFIPSLVAILLSTEKKKGSPLTQREVEAIRDSAAVLVSDSGPAQAVEERRGYVDIDPAHCWEQWQTLRVQFTQ